MEKGNENKL